MASEESKALGAEGRTVDSRREYRGVPLMATPSLYRVFAGATKRGAAEQASEGGSGSLAGGRAQVRSRPSHRRSSRAVAMMNDEENTRRFKLAAELVSDAMEGRSVGVNKCVCAFWWLGQGGCCTDTTAALPQAQIAAQRGTSAGSESPSLQKLAADSPGRPAWAGCVRRPGVF